MLVVFIMFTLEKLEMFNLKVTITKTICVIIKMSNSIVSSFIRNNHWEPPLRDEGINYSLII